MNNNITETYFIMAAIVWAISLTRQAYNGERGFAAPIKAGVLWPMYLITLLLNQKA